MCPATAYPNRTQDISSHAFCLTSSQINFAHLWEDALAFSIIGSNYTSPSAFNGFASALKLSVEQSMLSTAQAKIISA